jgi:hypothetical protein
MFVYWVFLLHYTQFNFVYIPVVFSLTVISEPCFEVFDSGAPRIIKFFIVLQLTIGAFDLGTPSLSANIDATVTVTVVRNLQTPYFLQSNYVTTIQENQAIGTSILQVSARDDDTTVSWRAGISIQHRILN